MSFDLYLMCCNIMIYGFKSNVNQGLLRKRDVIGLLKNEEIISNKIFNIFINFIYIFLFVGVTSSSALLSVLFLSDVCLVLATWW